jgi:hypothetical protein
MNRSAPAEGAGRQGVRVAGRWNRHSCLLTYKIFYAKM